jgi:hypothetical protein
VNLTDLLYLQSEIYITARAAKLNPVELEARLVSRTSRPVRGRFCREFHEACEIYPMWERGCIGAGVVPAPGVEGILIRVSVRISKLHGLDAPGVNRHEWVGRGDRFKPGFSKGGLEELLVPERLDNKVTSEPVPVQP